MGIGEQVERMAPRPTTPTEAERERKTCCPMHPTHSYHGCPESHAWQPVSNAYTFKPTSSLAIREAQAATIADQHTRIAKLTGELGVLRGLIREVVASRSTASAMLELDVPIRRDLWNRLVAAGRGE